MTKPFLTLLGLVMVLATGCRGTAVESPAPAVDFAQASADDPCQPGAGALVLFEGTYADVQLDPDERSFVSGGRSTAAMCAQAEFAVGTTVEVNGAVVFGPADFLEPSVVRTAAVPLLADNTVSVKLLGAECLDPGQPACPSLRLRVFGGATLNARAPASPDTCCHDPTCDRDAFAARGGVCPGDRRIRGALPHRAPAVSAQ